jgi:4,5-DOPA dioxygenase extradiol
VDGYAMGSISMTAYALGRYGVEPEDLGSAPPLPDVPADETNI